MGLRKNLGAILCSFVFVSQALATIILPVPIEDQLNEADGVIEAINLGQDFKKLSTGQVVTEYTFKILKYSGIRENQIINRNAFKVMVPGGTWQGIRYDFQGAPHFKDNEKSLLLLRKGPFGFQVSNLSLGKYSVYKEDGAHYVRSSIFPENPQLSNIPLKRFDSMVESRYGKSLSKFHHDKYVYKERSSSRLRANGEVKKQRQPASGLEKSEDLDDDGFNPAWLVIIFSVLGGVVAMRLRKYN